MCKVLLSALQYIPLKGNRTHAEVSANAHWSTSQPSSEAFKTALCTYDDADVRSHFADVVNIFDQAERSKNNTLFIVFTIIAIVSAIGMITVAPVVSENARPWQPPDCARGH